MTKVILASFFFFLFCGNALAEDIAPSYLKGEYALALIYGPENEFVIPLNVLKNKTVIPTPEGNFLYTDGIYCSTDGNYLEGLCRFKDKDGSKWEVRLSAEPALKKGHSIFTLNIYNEQKVRQQIDFAFKGRPGDILNMGITPFCIQGLPGMDTSPSSICLNVK